MSENRIQKEPSTEEILGSIRRIITEDNAQAGEAGASGIAQTAATELPVLTDDVAADEEATTELTTTEVTPADAAPGEIMSGEMATEDEEILELTDEVADEEPARDAPPMTGDQFEEIRREPRFGLSATPSYETDAGEDDGIRREPVIGTQADETPAEQQPQDNTGWTGADAEPLAGYNYSAQVLSSNQDTAGQEEYAMASPTDGEPEAPETPEIEETSQPAADPGAAQEEIVSRATTTATAAALGDLNRAVTEKAEKLKVGADTTVADIVKEMLRPMLREWMDENLPLIVDRVVRREIQKLVDRAQDDD